MCTKRFFLVTSACLLGTCVVAQAEIIGVGLGFVTPRPTTLGPYEMTLFPDDPRPIATAVTSVPSPLGGDVSFSIPLMHFKWQLPPWVEMPPPDVYISVGEDVTIQLPAGTRAVSLYVGTETGASQWVSVTADDQTTVTQITYSYMWPCYFGFYVDNPAETISTLEVPFDFAGDIGAFGIAVPEPGSLSLLGLALLVRRR
jgi:hypothetical protein